MSGTPNQQKAHQNIQRNRKKYVPPLNIHINKVSPINLLELDVVHVLRQVTLQ